MGWGGGWGGTKLALSLKNALLEIQTTVELCLDEQKCGEDYFRRRWLTHLLIACQEGHAAVALQFFVRGEGANVEAGRLRRRTYSSTRPGYWLLVDATGSIVYPIFIRHTGM